MTILTTCSLLSALSLLLPLALGQDTAPIVNLGYAKYQGAFASNISAFRGVRFAAPPVGSLRWREPQFPEAKPDVQNATAFGPACLQATPGLAATNPYTGVNGSKVEFGLEVNSSASNLTSEDWLFLSVYTPGLLDPENVTEHLPVVVWIHGGGYVAGSESFFTGGDLVRESGGEIIAVTIQYRLGLFGFLAGQAVKDGGILNSGLLDQQFALQWINTHSSSSPKISKFGGDPSRVTIWGESAGAGSVLQQQIYNDVVDSANCSSSEDSLECLRQVDATRLGNINSVLSAAGFYGTYVFVPVIDGTFITQPATEALRQRKFNAKTLLAVTNTNEGRLFVNASTTDTVVVSDYLSELFPRLSPENVEAVSLLYSNLGSSIDQVTAIMNDAIFVCPTYYLLEAFHDHAFKGQFAIPPALHAEDVFYYFPSIQGVNYTNPDFGKAFSESFTAFVSTQDPNDTFEPTITPAWNQYASDGCGTEMLFNRTEEGEPFIQEFATSTSLLERCAFWSTVGLLLDLKLKNGTGLDTVNHASLQADSGILRITGPMLCEWYLGPRDRQDYNAGLDVSNGGGNKSLNDGPTPTFIIQLALIEFSSSQEEFRLYLVKEDERDRRTLKHLMAFLLLCVGVLSVFVPSHRVYAATPTVDLGYATYQGAYSANISQFLGIRYAAPPVESLRWKEPQPPSVTRAIQDATQQPPACLQAPGGRAPTNPYPDLEERAANVDQEDCLFLNVYTPGLLDAAASDEDGLPVIVYIHGGGYVSGHVALVDDLLRESGNGIVAVSIQYRLGMFGFLAGQAVKDGGALNAGLLDQQFALKWVQEHISKFGGDPRRVTIWGKSAGAGSVLQQVIANGGATFPPLFRGAITSSTFLPSQYAYNDDIPEFWYSEVLKRTRHVEDSSAANTLDCLRGVDVATLEGINTELSLSAFYGSYVWVPVVDGTFIVQRPLLSTSLGRVNGEMFMAVTNTNEGIGFVDQTKADTVVVSDYLKELFPKLSQHNVDVATSLYEPLGAPITQVNAIMTDTIFVCPSYYLVGAFYGRSYKGQFAVPPATHASDSVYIFPQGTTPPYTNKDFQKAFSESFTAFITSLDPSDTFEPTIAPSWARYHDLFSGGRTEMLFNRTESGEPWLEPFQTSNSLSKRCLFWSTVGHETGQ
ncbi:alpha/beta-hydrolase [Hymenopellis radicata]|nr:alpha/beta-hydrolase [Hymenopellis radicata]